MEEEYSSDEFEIDYEYLRIRRKYLEIPNVAIRIWENVIKKYKTGDHTNYNSRVLANCQLADIEQWLYRLFEKKYGEAEEYF